MSYIIIVMDCIICLSEIKSACFSGTKCNHFYHLKCAKKWLNINHTCPLCKREMYYNFSNIHKIRCEIGESLFDLLTHEEKMITINNL